MNQISTSKFIQPVFLIAVIVSSLLLSSSISLASDKKADTESYWKIDDSIQLHHFSHGNGRKVLIVHGGPGVPFLEPIPALDELSDQFEFIYYDQRGCGKSTRPIESFVTPGFMTNFGPLTKKLGLNAQIDDIEQIRKILGEDKLIIIGHSFGAFIASLYAKKYPGNVEAMIFVAPADLLVFPPPDGGLFVTMKKFLPDSLQTPFDKFLVRYMGYSTMFTKTESELVSLNCEFMPFFIAAGETKGMKAPADISCEPIGGWMVHGIYLSMGMQYDHRDSLKLIKAPVLVLHGENDIQSEASSRTYSDTYPNSTFIVIENAGHFMFNDQPGIFAKNVGEFLNRLE